MDHSQRRMSIKKLIKQHTTPTKQQQPKQQQQLTQQQQQQQLTQQQQQQQQLLLQQSKLSPHHHKNTLQIITTKLKINSNSLKLKHKTSFRSLFQSQTTPTKLTKQQTPPISPSPSKHTPKQSLEKLTNQQQQQTDREDLKETFSLKSFRNVRTTVIQPTPTITTQSTIPATTTTTTRPPSITTISRPSSPSSKISAAAFREARAARNSRSITSLSFPETTTPSKSRSPSPNPPPFHSTFKPFTETNPTNTTTTTTQSYHRPNTTTLYNDNEILLPPRPPFYGSRMPTRSISSDQRSSLYQPPPSSRPKPGRAATNLETRSLYTNPSTNMSSISLRSHTQLSTPAPQQPHRRRSTTTTTSATPIPKTSSMIPKTLSNPTQPQLEQWHSDDDEDDNHHPASSTKNHLVQPRPVSSFARPTQPDRSRHSTMTTGSERKNVEDDDEEDEVPLSKLKKKSFSSLRGTAMTTAAQTLARERQQLHNTNRPTPPANPAGSSPLAANHPPHLRHSYHHAKHLSNVSLLSNPEASNPRQRNSKLLTVNGLSAPALPRPDSIRTILQPRGNSPASSSSGSGSGSWSIPITPRDSVGNLNMLLPPAYPHPHQQQHQHPGGFADQHKARASFLNHHPARPDLDPRASVAGLAHPPMGPHDELAAPPIGVDPFLYSSLGVDQKMELHQRSEMMKQMMAAQAGAAAQMHAMALSSAARRSVDDPAFVFGWPDPAIHPPPAPRIDCPPAGPHLASPPSQDHP